MAKLTPIDFDPFSSASEPPKGGKLTPVEGDPFAEKPSIAEDVAKSAGSGLAKGVAGLVTAPVDMPKMAEYGVSYLLAKAAEKAGLMPKGKTAEDFVRSAQETFGAPEFASPKAQQWIEKNIAPLHEPQTTAGRYAESVSEMAPTIMAGPGRLLQKGAQTIGAGVGSEAAGEAAKGTPYEPWARIAGGVVGGLTPNAASRVITPLPVSKTRLPLIAELEAEGVPLTAGQKTGSRGLQYAESVLGDMPGAGGKARAIDEAQKTAFTEAATRRAGMPGLATQENMANRYEAFDPQFGGPASRNTLRMDPRFGQDIARSWNDYAGLVNPSQQAPAVRNYVNDIFNMASQSGQIPGETYNSMRSRLGLLARRASTPEDEAAFLDIQRALDKGMERSATPEDAALLKQARREYANYKAIEKARGSAGASTAEGYISPAQLKQAVSAGKDKARYVRGEGDLAKLANAGVGAMPQLPNSGTPARQYVQGLLGGVGGAIGAAAAGAPGAAVGATLPYVLPPLAGRALMSAPIQAYLGNQLLKGGLAPNGSRALGLLMLTHPELRDQLAQ